MEIKTDLTPASLKGKLQRFWDHSGRKIRSLREQYDLSQGSPVFTVKGKYTTRGWTEWTQGFQFGSEILQFDATGDAELLAAARESVVEVMAPHVTHMGVHDHGFNNVSTYGNLRRLMNEGRIPDDPWQRHFYELALKASGAVQARRFTPLPDGGGYIYSFNGPQSLFSDTIRSCRALAVSHTLGHVLQGENDVVINLLERLIDHARATAKFNVYFGEGRDVYDLRGRVVHESIFNINDGNYRCPSTQQGYSPFSTWTRGLAWIITGYAEQLEFFETLEDAELEEFGGRGELEALLRRTAEATCDFYIENSATDGIPYWDTGAPGLAQMGDYLERPSDPYNDHEPVDSSAAAISAQGLLRLGHWLSRRGEPEKARRCTQAGLTVMDTLLDEPYLSTDDAHQGLILHSVYHRPNGWDHVPADQKVPCGESSMWGDYHAREAALYVQRLAEGGEYLRFWG
ncbi:MAG: glycosyl hydrolase [Phycisphaerae bacterium]